MAESVVLHEKSIWRYNKSVHAEQVWYVAVAHLASTALSTVNGVEILSLIVSCREDRRV